jgi:hypothetical protein
LGGPGTAVTIFRRILDLNIGLAALVERLAVTIAVTGIGDVVPLCPIIASLVA